MILPLNSKLLFIGDSITDAGRDPSGEETPWGAPGFGNGYVSMVNSWLVARYSGTRIRVINNGIGGNTVLDLKARWQRDVLDHAPDWLCVMIGINDVWRQFDMPLRPETHVLPDLYERTLDELLAQTRPTLPGGLILATPYMIEPNRNDAMRKRMDEYGAIVKKLAARYEARFVDTQGAFDAVLQNLHPMGLAWDRIHPRPAGHMVIAQAVLQALEAI